MDAATRARRAALVGAPALACALAVWATHDPPPLDDPIPGEPPVSPVVVVLEEVAGGFSFPTDVAEVPDGSGRLLVCERSGRVLSVLAGTVRAQPFLQVATAANGGSALSAIAFHPDFATAGDADAGLLYTVSQDPLGQPPQPADLGDPVGAVHQSVVYEWRVSAGDPDLVDPASQREILRIDESTIVHNLDDLAFGPDGMLYLAKGDDDAPASASLDGTTVHGSILRIELDAIDGYRVPADNPFVGDPTRVAEVYAHGFRNPWRLAFDRGDGTLWVADIGEDDIEEVDRVEAGGYYGWNDKEGSFAFLDFNGVTDDLSDLPAGLNAIDPVAEYDHPHALGQRRSITGGFVYRGALYPALAGHYVFGDLLSGELMHVDPADGVIRVLQIDSAGAQPGPGIISVRQDSAGELLLVVTEFNNNTTGRVLRWVHGSPAPLITVVEPARDRYTTGESVTITWVDEFPSAGATVSLYYDADNSGADGVLIASGIPEEVDAAGDTFDWDTTGVADGIYYLYATVTDTVTADTGYSSARVAIDRARTDSDTDSMADLWETLFFGGLGEDGTGDADNDGSRDGNEFAEQTDPLLPDLRMALVPGLNLVSFPIALAPARDSAALLNEFGGAVLSISRVDVADNTTETTGWNGGAIAGPVFSIEVNEGYYLEVASAAEAVYGGTAVSGARDLVPGTNLVGFTAVPDDYSAYDLLQAIGDDSVVSSIARSLDTGRFETAVYDGATPAGVDFPVERGKAYVIGMRGTVSAFSP